MWCTQTICQPIASLMVVKQRLNVWYVLLMQLQQYQLEKSKGHVFTQRPAEFNPARYVSVRTFEDVKLGQPISEEQMQRLLRR